MQWLCGEGGFAMDKYVMLRAARSGSLEAVQLLRGEGCPWGSGCPQCAGCTGTGS